MIGIVSAAAFDSRVALSASVSMWSSAISVSASAGRVCARVSTWRWSSALRRSAGGAMDSSAEVMRMTHRARGSGVGDGAAVRFRATVEECVLVTAASSFRFVVVSNLLHFPNPSCLIRSRTNSQSVILPGPRLLRRVRYLSPRGVPARTPFQVSVTHNGSWGGVFV